jgi:hypothetical protein
MRATLRVASQPYPNTHIQDFFTPQNPKQRAYVAKNNPNRKSPYLQRNESFFRGEGLKWKFPDLPKVY